MKNNFFFKNNFEMQCQVKSHTNNLLYGIKSSRNIQNHENNRDLIIIYPFGNQEKMYFGMSINTSFDYWVGMNYGNLKKQIMKTMGK